MVVVQCPGVPRGARTSLFRTSRVRRHLGTAVLVLSLAALLVGQFRYGKPDVLLTLIGLLGALVAITAGASVVAPHWAVLIGLVAGVLVPLASIHIDLIIRIDDPTAVSGVKQEGGDA